jgi:hypothetical protein
VFSININQKDKNKNDSTFLFLINPYYKKILPVYCTDLDLIENMSCLDETNFELRSKYLMNISAISQLSKFAIYDNGKFIGSSYVINKLQIIKRPGMSVYITLFYIKAPWDNSRSLVYAVLDSLGNEIYSKILVTEDSIIENNPQKMYKQTLYMLDYSHIEILVFKSTDFYGDLKAEQDYYNYLINEDGSLKLQQMNNNIKKR